MWTTLFHTKKNKIDYIIIMSLPPILYQTCTKLNVTNSRVWTNLEARGLHERPEKLARRRTSKLESKKSIGTPDFHGQSIYPHGFLYPPWELFSLKAATEGNNYGLNNPLWLRPCLSWRYLTWGPRLTGHEVLNFFHRLVSSFLRNWRVGKASRVTNTETQREYLPSGNLT